MDAAKPSSAGDTIAGLLFRAYLTGLDALGLRSAVRAQVSPQARELMDSPPLHSVWLEGRELTEILMVVAWQQGLEGVRQLGYEATWRSTGKFLLPAIQDALALHGGGPETAFRNMDSFCRPFFRGLRLTYTPESACSGTLELRSTYRMPAPVFAAWEGALLFVFDVCGVKGSLSPSRISEDGHVGTMKASW